MKEQIDIDSAFTALRMNTPENSMELSYQKLIDKIELIQRGRAPRSLILGTILLAIVVIGCNLLVSSHRNYKTTKESNLTSEMGLINNNSIYGGI
jgi:hypothetical protein